MTNVDEVKYNEEREEEELTKDDINVQKKRHVDPLKEKTILNIKKKDALGAYDL